MKVKARDYDKKFDEGADISKHLDVKQARRPGQEQRGVNVDFSMDDPVTGQRGKTPGGPSVDHQSPGGWNVLKRRRDRFYLSAGRDATRGLSERCALDGFFISRREEVKVM